LRLWLEPGIGVKRWLLLMILGTVLIGLGLAYVLLDLYRANPDSSFLAALSLTALPRWARALLLGAAGIGLLVLGGLRLNRTLLAPFVRPGKPVVDVVAEHRRLGRGPKIVAIGGGNGLATLLRGLKEHTTNLTAIVTVADDGGSSGRLRRDLGLPPPGDVRNCLAALSDDEDLLTQLFQYRFLEGPGLEGHSFGNLFIAALAGVTGSFDRGVLEAGHVLRIRGQVLPATLSDVALVADKTPALDAQTVRVQGESRIPDFPGRIYRVHLEPGEPPAYPETIRAVLSADMVVIGPGSLYTSLLPNLLVPDLAQAIRASRAFKVFVCNVAEQPGETDGFDCAQHLEALEAHVGPSLVDGILVNARVPERLPERVRPVPLSEGKPLAVPGFPADVIDVDRPWRHDSEKLAHVLLRLLEERTGPLDMTPIDRAQAANLLN
jgi:uncharacterized cofD-like protein